MAEEQKNLLQQTIDWFSGTIGSVGDLAKRVGWPLTVLIVLVAAGVFVWWKSEHIEKLPGIKWLIERLKRRAIPEAPTGHLTIAIAHLEGDEGGTQEEVLLDGLREFEGVDTLTVDRTVEWPALGTEQAKMKKAEKDARDLLIQTGADVLI